MDESGPLVWGPSLPVWNLDARGGMDGLCQPCEQGSQCLQKGTELQ